MKFKDLKFLFTEEIEKLDKKNLSYRYILIAYRTVYNTISDNHLDDEIVTDNKIDDLPITNNMKDKLKYLSKENISKELRDKQKKNKFVDELRSLIGIGKAKADELINMGLKNVKQLEQPKWFNMLNKNSQMVLVHKPTDRIPHEDIKKIAHKLESYKNAMLTGGYIRCKPYSGDMDILLKIENSNEANKEIDKYINYLKKQFDNNVYVYARGNQKLSLILQPFKNNENLHYKADIFLANKDNFYTMLLYTTGSKNHNVKMRKIANNKGYLLNQNGIYDQNEKKINKSTDDEHKLFKILEMSYIIPEKRL
jgi:DNA polymerase (family 10)